MIEEEDEIVNLINDFFKMRSWKVTKENIEKCNEQTSKNAKIYKLKKDEIYFMIILEKEPNYHLAYKILTYCIKFIEKWKIKKHKQAKLPIIIPIIIYSGEKNWNIKLSKNIKYTSFKENGMNLSYNIIDLHKHKTMELIRKKSLISNVSILKQNNNKEIQKNLLKIRKNNRF